MTRTHRLARCASRAVFAAVCAWTGAAYAGVPRDARLIALPWETAERWRAEGRVVCVPAPADGLGLCLALRSKGEQRWVAPELLVTWGVDEVRTFEVLTRRAAKKLARAGEWRSVDGMDGRYWLAADGSGWAAAAIVCPDTLRELLGGAEARLASPNYDVIVAWAAGDEDFDLVMAVGVRDMYERQPLPITSTVLSWNGARWAAWADVR